MRSSFLLLAAAILGLVACASDATSDADTRSDTAPPGDTSPADVSDAASPADTVAPDSALADVAPTRVDTTPTLTASDGKAIAATATRLSTTPSGAPGVLLIHQFSQSRAQWDPYLDALVAEGWIVLAIDLRGHGGSDAQDGSFTGVLTDPDGAPRDVRAGLAWLAGVGGADPQRLAIGTSVGANLACVASSEGAAKLAVAVSARDTSVAALAGAGSPEDLSFSGLFILAAEQDGGGAQAATADAFYAQAAAPRRKRIDPGSAHGKDLIAAPGVFDEVVGWLRDHL